MTPAPIPAPSGVFMGGTVPATPQAAGTAGQATVSE